MRIGLITINDNNNFGNRLQNYALYKYLTDNFNFTVENVYNNSEKTKIGNFLEEIKWIVKSVLKRNKYLKRKKFKEFNKLIPQSKFKYYINSSFNELSYYYDYLVVGSDQVWNPNYKRLSKIDVLEGIDNNKRISYAASFGINEIGTSKISFIKKEIGSFKAISVREEQGIKILSNIIERNDMEVNIDPTLLLESSEWLKLEKKPENLESKKFILNYFLGSLSDNNKKAIEKFAKDNDCDVINILDKNDKCYISGPSEFLYLENHAFMICTDSFHASIFAFLFNKPFVIFERRQKGVESMNSRLNTFIRVFDLKNRNYNGKNITNDNLSHNYKKAFEVLKNERKKSEAYFKKAFTKVEVRKDEKSE